MTTFEIFALAWIPISVAIIVLFAFNADRIEGLFLRGKRHTARPSKPRL